MRRLLPLASTLVAAACSAGAADVTLLNASYDSTRELFADVNQAFAARWKQDTGKTLVVHQSHGGSGKQARSVIEGLRADVVTLALSFDVDKIASESGRIEAGWAQRLPHGGSPFYSTIVFVVRKGNPLRIRDWDDLVKPGVRVVTPHPKSSGGARWNYLGAWVFALHRASGDQARAEDFIRALYRNAPMLDPGARASSTTFALRGIGDVLISWENEAELLRTALGSDAFDVVTPSVSIRADLPVAVVDATVDRRGTRALAQAYLEFLFSRAGQELALRHHLRPRDKAVLAAHPGAFPSINLVAIDSLGGWSAVNQQHFADGAFFDSLEVGR